jgi:aconitate hydratase
VVDKFVEFFGPGLMSMSLPDRATVANMSPEYGATMGFFPVDAETLNYLRLTGRPAEQIELVETYCREQGLFREPGSPEPEFTDTLELDLGSVVPSLAGPKRPQDRVALGDMKKAFQQALTAPVKERGFELKPEDVGRKATVGTNGSSLEIGHGAVVIAAITSCTNTSNPSVLEVAKAVSGSDLVAAAVISGNRNFEGRVHPLVRANYLASPPLVVAFALAGRVDLDMEHEPLGTGKDGQPVYLRDLWPSVEEIRDAMTASVRTEMFSDKYASVFAGSEMWKDIRVSESELFPWDETSTYIHHPPFFQELTVDVPHIGDIRGARVLGLFGDSITTDHISPAGNIAADSPAGKWLQENGVQPKDFNQYGTRRGNDEVLVRGTFANIRLKNLLVAPKEGWYTRCFPSGEEMSFFDAAQAYRSQGVPLIVLAGKEYGTGSSRDWAAKGPLLLGVRAVIAESFERIHRSNLVGMGILPLQFLPGQNAESLHLTGFETFDIVGIAGADPQGASGSTTMVEPKQRLTVRATAPDGNVTAFEVASRIDTPVEVGYYRNGGILQTVLRQMMKA